MVRVLFVCMGNICRSPMAEAVFADKVRKAGLSDRFMIDSAGTGDWHTGETAHKGTLAILKKYNIEYHGHARGLVTADFENFDYLLAMDETNLATLRARQPHHARPNMSFLLDYAPHRPEREVPDPYYDGRFEYVYELVQLGSQGLLEAICKDKGW